MQSPAVEDYLKAIYKLQGAAAATTTDIARSMNVSSASVTNMVKRLADMKLVAYESYRGVTLTPAGEKIALEIIRHHRLLELYLKEVMGYGWEQLHEEAERLEHHISEEFESKLEELLGYPTHDPHGDPIPTREGEISERVDRPLAEIEEPGLVTIRPADAEEVWDAVQTALDAGAHRIDVAIENGGTEVLLQNSGRLISAATVAAEVNGRTIIGTAGDDRFLMCRPAPQRSRSAAEVVAPAEEEVDELAETPEDSEDAGDDPES